MDVYEVMLLSGGGMSLVMLGVLASLWQSQSKGIGEWLIANAFAVVSFGLYAFGWARGTSILLEVGNTLYAATSMMILAGYRRFYSRPPGYPAIAAVLLGLFLGLCYFHYVHDLTRIRIILVSGVHAGAGLMVLRTVRTDPPTPVSRIALRFARVVAVFLVLFLLARVGTQLWAIAEGQPLLLTTYLKSRDVIYLALGVLLLPSLTLAGASMVTSRLVLLAHKEAKTDFLTGAWTRRALLEFAEREIDRAARIGHPLSLLILDVDDFKRINDLHGHLVGDTVLTDLALLAGNSVRGNDYFCRMGGEEFAILMPDTDRRAAVDAAERLRALLGTPRADGIRYTVSVGVAEHIPGDAWRDLYKAADDALAQAKRDGKDRVAVAPIRPVAPALAG